MLGGRYESYDKTALHTGIREFVEELFNVKLDTYKVDELVKHLIVNEDIIHDYTMKSPTSASYFASFKTLGLIYNFIYHNKYEIIEPFDLAKFMETRNYSKSKCAKADGLCEIDFISVVYLSKVHLLPLRNFSINFLNKLKDKLS